MEEAVDADRVIVMEKGKKLLEGTPKEVFSKIDTCLLYTSRQLESNLVMRTYQGFLK